MNSEPAPAAEETGDAYSLEVIAALAGVNTQTVLHYQERGFLHPSTADDRSPAVFDTECLRQLRRIEHLRSSGAMNDAGLELFLDLLHEVECLRQERRQWLR